MPFLIKEYKDKKDRVIFDSAIKFIDCEGAGKVLVTLVTGEEILAKSVLHVKDEYISGLAGG